MKPYAESTHVVVDIETLGIETGSPIIQIAAMRLRLEDDRAVIDEKFNNYINLESNFAAGLTTYNPNTIEWWLCQARQNEVAFDALTYAIHGKNLEDVVQDFNWWLKHRVDENTYFWSRGMDFDFRHLEHALKRFFFEPPWHFWQLRDIRTIDDPVFLGNYQRGYNPHDALVDVDNDIQLLAWAIYKKNVVYAY